MSTVNINHSYRDRKDNHQCVYCGDPLPKDHKQVGCHLCRLQRSMTPSQQDRPSQYIRKFAPEFVEMVANGTKFSTIRNHPKRKPQPGDILVAHTAEGATIGRYTIASCDTIGVYRHFVQVSVLKITHPAHLDDFAKTEGFPSYAHLTEWFRKNMRLPFMGVRIVWKPSP